MGHREIWKRSLLELWSEKGSKWEKIVAGDRELKGREWEIEYHVHTEKMLIATWIDGVTGERLKQDVIFL